MKTLITLLLGALVGAAGISAIEASPPTKPAVPSPPPPRAAARPPMAAVAPGTIPFPASWGTSLTAKLRAAQVAYDPDAGSAVSAAMNGAAYDQATPPNMHGAINLRYDFGTGQVVRVSTGQVMITASGAQQTTIQNCGDLFGTIFRASVNANQSAALEPQ